MQNPNITEKALEILNRICKRDNKALSSMLLNRIATNEDYVDDPQVVCSKHNELTALGILNSILSASGSKRVCACVDDSGSITHFEEYEI